MMLRALRADPSPREDNVVSAVTALSMGWPSHLFIAQKELTRELRALDGNLSQVNMDHVRKASNDARIASAAKNARATASYSGVRGPLANSYQATALISTTWPSSTTSSSRRRSGPAELAACIRKSVSTCVVTNASPSRLSTHWLRRRRVRWATGAYVEGHARLEPLVLLLQPANLILRIMAFEQFEEPVKQPHTLRPFGGRNPKHGVPVAEYRPANGLGSRAVIPLSKVTRRRTSVVIE